MPKPDLVCRSDIVVLPRRRLEAAESSAEETFLFILFAFETFPSYLFDTVDIDIGISSGLLYTSRVMATNSLIPSLSSAAVFNQTWPFWLLSCVALIAAAARWFLSFWRLRKIPGPSIAAFTRAWLLNTVNSEDAAQRYAATSQTYGL